MKIRGLLVLLIILTLVPLLSVNHPVSGLPAPDQSMWPPASAPAETSPDLAAQIEGAASAVAVQEGYAYVGIGSHLVIVDVADPANPVVLGHTPTLPGLVNNIFVAGSLAYVAAGNAGLRIIDVSNPIAPVEIGSLDTAEDAQAVVVAGTHIYLGDGAAGLRVIDASVPSDPREIGFTAWDAGIWELAVNGPYVYAVDGYDLRIFDAANPAAPNQVGGISTTDSALDVAVSGNYAYVADDWDGLMIADVADPTIDINFVDPRGGQVTYAHWHLEIDAAYDAQNVAVVDSFAYVTYAAFEAGLQIINVGNTQRPEEAARIALDNSPTDLTVAGPYAYITDERGGLTIVAIGTPYSPSQVGFVNVSRAIQPADEPAGPLAGQAELLSPDFPFSEALILYLAADGTLLIENVADGAQAALTAPGTARRFGLAPTRRHLYYVDAANQGWLLALDFRADGSLQATRATLPAPPPLSSGNVIWSPSGEKLAYSDESGRFWAFTMAGELITLPGNVASVPGWSFDDSWLSYCLSDNTLWVVAGEEPAIQVADSVVCRDPFSLRVPAAWSPTEPVLAYTRGNPNAPPLPDTKLSFAYHATTGETWQLPNGSVVGWSPNGSLVAVSLLLNLGTTGGTLEDVSVADARGEHVLKVGSIDARGAGLQDWPKSTTDSIFGRYRIDGNLSSAEPLAEALFGLSVDGQRALLADYIDDHFQVYCRSESAGQSDILFSVDFSNMSGAALPGLFGELSPDGEWAVVNYYQELSGFETWLSPCASAQPAMLNDASLATMSFSADSRWLAMIADSAGELMLHALAGGPSSSRAIAPGTDAVWLLDPYALPPTEEEAPGTGGRIVLASNRGGDYDIYVMDVSTGRMTRLTSDPADDTAPAWSPDGLRLAFVSNRDGNEEIYVMNADTTGLTRLTDNPGLDTSPVWSPDGTQIAFESVRDGNTDIYIVNVDGSGLARLTTHPARDAEPTWKEEEGRGSLLLFSSNRDGNREIYHINADGSGLGRVTNSPTHETGPVWLPTHLRMAFVSTCSGNEDIFILPLFVDFAGDFCDAFPNLTNNPTRDIWPTWSPDGSQFAFMSSRSGDSQIYIANADGSEQTPLTEGPKEHLHPAWSPVAGSATVTTYYVSGRVVDTDGNPIESAEVLTEFASSVLTDQDGRYMLLDLPAGYYTLDVSKEGYTFSTELEQPIQVIANRDEVNFVGTPEKEMYTVSGRVIDCSGDPVEGVVIEADSGNTVVTNEDGLYTFEELEGRKTHTFTPQAREGIKFNPEDRVIVDIWEDAARVDFTAMSTAQTEFCITHMEIIQVVQDEHNSAPLIAGKPTLVRVYVDCGEEDCASLSHVRGELRALNEEGNSITTEDGEVLESINSISPSHEDWRHQRDEKDKSLNFLLPPEWIQNGSITLKATVNDVSREETFTFEPGIKLRLYYVEMPVFPELKSFPPPPHPPPTPPLPSDSYVWPNKELIQDGKSFLQDIYPVALSDLKYEQQTPFEHVIEFPFECNRQEYCPTFSEYLLILNTYWNAMNHNGSWRGGIQPDRLYGWVPEAAFRGKICGIASSLWARTPEMRSFVGDDLFEQLFHGRVAAGIDKYCGGTTLAHEIGHLLNEEGLGHTPNLGPIPNPDLRVWDRNCSSENSNTVGYPNYPGPLGTIGHWGVRFLDNDFTLINPSVTYDFMSYCSPIWISLFNYKRLYEGFLDLSNFDEEPSDQDVIPGDLSPVRETEIATPRFLVSGTVFSPTLSVSINPMFVITSTAPILPSYAGNYCLELRSKEETKLDERCFDLSFRNPETGESIGVDTFSLVLPYPEGTRAVVMTYSGAELSRVSASTNKPQVQLVTPNGGEKWKQDETYTITWEASDSDDDTLHFALYYSEDNGQTWVPFVLDTTLTSWSSDASRFPGSASALLRVDVSDGFYTSSDISDAPFDVEAKVPEVVIRQRMSGPVLAGSPLWLQGYGFDVEDGALDDEALQWYSDLDGALGTGRQIFTKLSAGQHVVTLTATDSDGDTGTATINFNVSEPGADLTEATSPGSATPLPAMGLGFAPWLAGGLITGTILFGVAFLLLRHHYPSLLPATISGRLSPTQELRGGAAAWTAWLPMVAALVGVLVLASVIALLAYRWSQPDPASDTLPSEQGGRPNQGDESSMFVAVSATPPAPTGLPATETAVLPTTTAAPTVTAPATPTLSIPTPTPTTAPTATANPGPENLVIGQSVRGVPIEAVRFGNGPNKVVFVGGLHAGYAPSSVALAEQAIEHFNQNPQAVPGAVTVYIVKSANPDSPYAPGELSGRLNANGVDLNRNWDCRWARDAAVFGSTVPGSGGSAPLSEPETRALADFILTQEAKAVVVWAAQAPNGLASPGSCGDRTQVSKSLTRTYGSAAGYSIANFENLADQVINGDSTNWLDQQGIPAIAVLLPDYVEVDWPANLAGMLAVLETYSN